MTERKNILEVRNLCVYFPIKTGMFSRISGYVKAVDDISFEMKRGETLGVVGESGCGKSTMSRAILRLNKPKSGKILFDSRDICSFAGRRQQMAYRRLVQVVFQDPLASLNPRHTVAEILTEGMKVHGLCRSADRRAKAVELLEMVGLKSEFLDRYPHEFSGGQRQRICIARALALQPELLICDEAVSALDLSVRSQILDLLADLKKRFNLSILFISHDLGVVQHCADRIIVMNAGKIVEEGTCEEVIRRPKNEYTKRLLASVPRIS